MSARWLHKPQVKRFVVIGVSAAAVGSGLALGLASAGASPFGLASEDLTAPAVGGAAGAIPASIADAFAVARHQRTAADVLPADALQSLGAPGTLSVHFGVNPVLSRFAGQVGGVDVWLVPGDPGSCIWVASGAAVCGLNAQVSVQGLTLVLIPVSGAPSSAIGILPDGASLAARNGDGSAATVVTSGDAYSVTGQASTTHLTLQAADGTSVDLGDLSTTPSPPGS
jgi:hypothetical protein